MGTGQVDIEALKASIKEAEREVDLAERQVKNKKLLLNSLKKQLQDAVISGVSGLKVKQEEENVKVKTPAPPKDEATRRAEVRRRWRILGMKIKFGLEILKLYDKNNDNTMTGNELFRLLTNLGEKLTKEEAKGLMKELCEPEDDDGFMPFIPFLEKMCAAEK